VRTVDGITHHPPEQRVFAVQFVCSICMLSVSTHFLSEAGVLKEKEKAVRLTLQRVTEQGAAQKHCVFVNEYGDTHRV
jgi:hypothetical protein